MHLVPLIFLDSSLFMRILLAGSVLCTLLHVPHKIDIGQTVPQINNVFIQGMEGIHNLFSHNLVDEIQLLDLLLEPSDFVLLIVFGVLASIFFLAAHLVFTASGLMILDIPPVVGLVGPVLQSLNFLKSHLMELKLSIRLFFALLRKLKPISRTLSKRTRRVRSTSSS